ncbi:MAG: FAD-dependent oxidoreductase, partial [Phycisphaerae bacterium]|nr:FAD-dependent oxidoreductase [Phycisphaerae bacterium]
LGEVDASGRRRPVPVPGSEFSLSLNTLIVAIGERPDSDGLPAMGLVVDKGGRLQVDPRTLGTGREGVFAGGDVVTGPNTVVDAIAAGRRAAGVIDRYLRGQELAEAPRIRLPDVFVESATVTDEEREDAARAEPPALPIQARRKNFAEVELALSAEQATREARRCLRCDLAFTQPQSDEAHSAAAGGTSA